MDLANTCVLISRPAASAQKWLAGFRALGATAVHQPGLLLTGSPSDEPSLALLSQITDDDALVFSSPAAVIETVAHQAGERSWQRATCWAVGRQTARELVSAGCRRVRAPAAGYGSQALLDDPSFPSAERTFLCRARDGRTTLVDGLTDRGLTVASIFVYTRAPAPLSADAADAVKACLADAGQCLVTTAASIAVLRRLDELFPGQLTAQPLVVLGERIAQAARDLGFTKIVVAQDPGLASAIEAVRLARQWAEP